MEPSLPGVLVVEDDDLVRESVAHTLARHGFRPVPAASAEAALPHLSSRALVAAIVDLRLPGLDGHAVLDACRSAHPGLPVILMSGDPTLDDALRAVRARADDLLCKPVAPPELVETLRRVLARAAVTPRPERPGPAPAAAPAAVVPRPRPTVRDEVHRAAERLQAGRLRLPTLDRRVAQVSGLMERPDCSVDEVLALLERDPTLAAVVLRAANSSYFNRGTRIHGLRDACLRLGNQHVVALTIEGLVTSACVCRREPFRTIVERFWQNAFVTARAVDWLSRHVARGGAGPPSGRRPSADELYVAGLLHNVGELLLVQVLADVPELELSGAGDLAELAEAVTEAHERFGGALAEAWGLPPLVAALAGGHHEEPLGEPPPGAVAAGPSVWRLVVAGWRLALSAGYMYLPGQEQESPFEDVVALGIDDARVAPLLGAMAGWLSPAAPPRRT
jgi:HD-like signal output (HDOD) protein/CheY-like chemotaxis protein